ncbi:MAG: D-aminopeptidase [bacterium]|nr:D-aminopeptidase [bacterium]
MYTINRRWTAWRVLCLFCFILYACSDDNPVKPDDPKHDQLRQQLQSMLDSLVTKDAAIHNTVLLVEAPTKNFKFKGASGEADPNAKIKMEPDDLFRTASIGKMTCATLALKLVEAGKLGLDDKINQYLPEAIMAGLHEYQGQSYGAQITIRQLLGHTSGLPDYILDGDQNGNQLPDFIELMLMQPEKFWQPEETIAYTKANLTPHFPPGQGYHYSDTNYQLLGLIIQNVTGKALHEVYRERLFSPLGMNNTYVEFYDAPRPALAGRGLSHVYFGPLDYTDLRAISADWAGGGLASTTEDLNRFIRAFVDDKIFQNVTSKNAMLTWNSTGEYGLGVAQVDYAANGINGVGVIIGHDGFPGSFMFYWPDQDITIVGTINQFAPATTPALIWVAEILKQVKLQLNS